MAEENKLTNEEAAAQLAPPPPASKPSKSIKRFQRKSKVVVISLGTVAGALLAIGTVVNYVWQPLAVRREHEEREQRCRLLIESARAVARKDLFDESIQLLDGEVDESKELAAQCKQNKDLEMLRREIELFKIASEYDQFTLADGGEKLQDIDLGLSLLRGMREPGDVAEFDTLGAVLEDLRDRPNEAQKIYKNIEKGNPDYANLFNHWGYTIFRWRLGGADWPRRALEKFAQAAQLDPEYAWPHINVAAVHLSLAEDALEETPARHATVEAELRMSREALEHVEEVAKAGEHGRAGVRKFTKQPRVLMLWARYNLIQGRLHQQRKRAEEADRSFYQAADHLLEALGTNEGIPDAHLLLGSVYEELWLARGSAAMQDKAAQAFRRAVALDDKNLEASMKLSYCLYRHEDRRAREEGAREAMRGRELVQAYRGRFRARQMKTNDPGAQNWLHEKLNMLDAWEANFKAMSAGLGGRAVSGAVLPGVARRAEKS